MITKAATMSATEDACTAVVADSNLHLILLMSVSVLGSLLTCLHVITRFVSQTAQLSSNSYSQLESDHSGEEGSASPSVHRRSLRIQLRNAMRDDERGPRTPHNVATLPAPTITNVVAPSTASQF